MKLKPKRVSYELIAPDGVVGHPMYALLHELVAAFHVELLEARIALAWCTSWQPDIDGRVTLGKCKKASDLDRELMAFDFIILLRKSFWLDDRVPDDTREGILDHELCHAARKYDHRGEPMVDERGRGVYRIRKHDIEEFAAVPARHGFYKRDVERFYAVLRKHDAATPYRACEACRESPGWVPVLDDQGVPRVKRCACYLQWAEQLAEAV